MMPPLQFCQLSPANTDADPMSALYFSCFGRKYGRSTLFRILACLSSRRHLPGPILSSKSIRYLFYQGPFSPPIHGRLFS